MLPAVVGVALAWPASAEITIAHVCDQTGDLEAYAEQPHVGLMMGLEYATDGMMGIGGEPIAVIEKDTQGQPEVGRSVLAEAYGSDGADIAV